MTYTVYKHITPSGKIYIGITSMKPEKRWDNGNGYRTQVFYYAIQKYDWKNIHHIIIADGLSKEQAEDMETYLISLYKSNCPDYGYNVERGGNSNGKCAEVTKVKISKSLKLYYLTHNSPNVGKALSHEHKLKLSLAHTGKRLSEEHCHKIGDSERGEKHWTYGKSRPIETRSKISQSLKGRPVYDHSVLYKKVFQYTRDGTLINEYSSLTDASKQFNSKYAKSNISACCHDKTLSAYGYVWRFADDKTE